MQVTYFHCSSEDTPAEDSSFKAEELRNRPEDLLSQNTESEAEEELPEIIMEWENQDSDGEETAEEEAEVMEEDFMFDDQINLRQEFLTLAFIILHQPHLFASPRNLDRWMDFAGFPADLYFRSFDSPSEIIELIKFFLKETQNANSPYKIPLLVILATWVVNLRKPFFKKMGYDIFKDSEIIAEMFDAEPISHHSKELQLAMNLLRMPLI